MKALNKEKKIIYSMAKRSSTHRELKKIKNIRAKASKKHESSIIISSSSDSYPSLSSDSYW